jgi:hypothetical protein
MWRKGKSCLDTFPIAQNSGKTDQDNDPKLLKYQCLALSKLLRTAKMSNNLSPSALIDQWSEVDKLEQKDRRGYSSRLWRIT